MDDRTRPRSLQGELIDLGFEKSLQSYLGGDFAKKRWEWSLVLEARGIEHRIDQGAAEGLLVQEGLRSKALREILAYERENAPAEAIKIEFKSLGGLEPTFWAMLFLALFYRITHSNWVFLDFGPEEWTKAGSMDVWAFFQGECWRAVTALSLHQDPAHLIGNLVIGGVFIGLVCRQLGSGPGWILVLASGVLGNALNACVQEYTHVSIGFSTAVFGAVGILGGLRTFVQEKTLQLKFLPLAAGLGILSMFGSGGVKTDLGAHLMGFAAGFGLGLLAGLLSWENRSKLAKKGWLFGLFGLAAFAGSWYLALNQAAYL